MERQIKAEVELVLIPSPGRGHLSAALEMANLLLDRDQRLSVTVLVIMPSFDKKSSTPSFSHQFPESNPRNIRFVDITLPESSPTTASPGILHVHKFIESHKNRVRAEVAKIVQAPDSGRKLAGFVVDVFCTSMIGVADEFGLPTYLFFTSGAATMGLMLHFQALKDDQNQDLEGILNSTDEISISMYELPIPVKVLPSMVIEKNSRDMFMNMARNLRQTKGIIVNTFRDLELPAMRFLAEDANIPPVYPVGPILHVDIEDSKKPKHHEIMKWLDEQPDSSVVFLCFGSRGCFDEVQVKEIAIALEKSGHRFLWSLRKPPSENSLESPGEYENPSEILPEGFIQRTAGTGKVIGWAPQVAVLSHRAVGGFVSHCGWNSTLESLWCGVPIAAWPLFAEQSMNAFQLVKELGVAVEINMEYKKSSAGANMVVRADVIETGIRCLMEPESDIRVKMDVLKDKSRMTLLENGSSFESVGRFINDVIANMA